MGKYDRPGNMDVTIAKIRTEISKIVAGKGVK